MATKNATKRQAEAILQLVKREFWQAGYNPPTLNMTWGWSGRPTPTILWEEGPCDWAIEVLSVCFNEQPANVWCEPYSGWALAVYQETT